MKDDAHKRDRSVPKSPTKEAAQAFAAAAEAAIADLELRLSAGMGPAEQAEAARIRAAIARVADCADRLGREALLIPGSTGQARVNPLVKLEHELRREISQSLQKLAFRVENRAQLVRIQAVHRSRRAEAKPRPAGQPDAEERP